MFVMEKNVCNQMGPSWVHWSIERLHAKKARALWLKEKLYAIKRDVLWFIRSKESCMQKIKVLTEEMRRL